MGKAGRRAAVWKKQRGTRGMPRKWPSERIHKNWCYHREVRLQHVDESQFHNHKKNTSKLQYVMGISAPLYCATSGDTTAIEYNMNDAICICSCPGSEDLNLSGGIWRAVGDMTIGWWHARSKKTWDRKFRETDGT